MKVRIYMTPNVRILKECAQLHGAKYAHLYDSEQAADFFGHPVFRISSLFRIPGTPEFLNGPVLFEYHAFPAFSDLLFWTVDILRVRGASYVGHSWNGAYWIPILNGGFQHTPIYRDKAVNFDTESTFSLYYKRSNTCSRSFGILVEVNYPRHQVCIYLPVGSN